jgi:predicted DNA-binding WGR domain protein
MPDARIIPVGYPICLQATDPERNIARRYTILLQRDFFGVITVDYSWGRIGSTGNAGVRPSRTSTRPNGSRASC